MRRPNVIGCATWREDAESDVTRDRRKGRNASRFGMERIGGIREDFIHKGMENG